MHPSSVLRANLRANNIYFINVAKTFAISLVALAHLPVPNGVSAFINSFHMPLFFLISGYLLKTDGILQKDFVLKKFRTLLIPYFVFVLISFVFWYFAGRKFGEDALAGYDIKKYLMGIFLVIPSKEYLGFNLPMWFLPSLFCAEVLLFQIRRLKDKYAFPVVVVCFAFGILLHEIHLFRLPWGLDVCLFSMFFIQTGKCLRSKNLIEKYIVGISLPAKILTSLVCLGICIYVSHLNNLAGPVYVYKCQFNNYLLFLVGAFSGSLFVLYLSDCLPHIGLMNFFGRNTLLIMSFHLICFSLIKGVQVFVFHIPVSAAEDSLLVCILYVVLVFVMLSPVIYIINKYFPFLLGRGKTAKVA